jgi:hypothetical protein
MCMLDLAVALVADWTRTATARSSIVFTKPSMITRWCPHARGHAGTERQVMLEY